MSASGNNCVKPTGNTSLAVLCKNQSEVSADGTLTVYYRNRFTWDIDHIGIYVRAQGVSTVDNDVVSYTVRESFDGTNNVVALFKNTGTGGSGAGTNLTPSSVCWYIGQEYYLYAMELRIKGSSIKFRYYNVYDKTWLPADGVHGSWQSTPTDCISVTDTGISAAGRIGFTNASGTSHFVCWDDVYWDPPDPTLSQSTATLSTVGGTVSLTAGGFSDPLTGVVWSSSNPSVATVTGGGSAVTTTTPCAVTAVADGLTTITATGSADSGQTATCVVTVKGSGVTVYPTYHQNWDGGTGSYPPGYGDWNLPAVGGTANAGFTVNSTAHVVSSPSGLNCAYVDTGGSTVICTKTAAESSANGKLSGYFKFGSVKDVYLRFVVRAQGLKLNISDSIAAYMLGIDISAGGDPSLHLVDGAQNHLVSAMSAPNIFDSTKTYIAELIVSGASQKVRVYNRSDGTWLQANGTWGSTAVDVFSATDSATLTAGRIGVGKITSSAGSIIYFDDIYWDPPAPALSQSTASLTGTGDTVSLSGGGFSDPFTGIVWSTSNAAVATVSGGGSPIAEGTACVVTGVASGTATITATGSANTSQTATCVVTVGSGGGGGSGSTIFRRSSGKRAGSRSLTFAR